MKYIYTILICIVVTGCHMCLECPKNVELGSTAFTNPPVKFSAEFECPQNPNSLLLVIRGMKDDPKTYCRNPEWKIEGFCSVSNLSQSSGAGMSIAQTNVVLGNWNTPDTTAILSFDKNVYAILNRGDRCRIDLTLTRTPYFTNKIDVMFHYIGSIKDKE